MKTRAKGKKPKQLTDDVPTIKLMNPVADHFKAFIFGNATKCERVVEHNSAIGKTVAICGAGPSLRDNLDAIDADEVWGCNSALTYLLDQGVRVTHGFTVDQTPHMLEEWASAPDVQYMLASTAHPHLVELLISKERQITFFHNFVGIKERPVAYGACMQCDGTLEPTVTSCPTCGGGVMQGILDFEDWMYASLYPRTIRAGSGLNTASRAIDVALFMGFDKIKLIGADCALKVNAPRPDVPFASPKHLEWLRNSVEMHADGGHALVSGATATTLGGEIDGRHWESKPDMLITAVWLVQMQRYWKDRIEIIGDTLPNALKNKPQSFLDRLPHISDENGVPARYVPPAS